MNSSAALGRLARQRARLGPPTQSAVDTANQELRAVGPERHGAHQSGMLDDDRLPSCGRRCIESDVDTLVDGSCEQTGWRPRYGPHLRAEPVLTQEGPCVRIVDSDGHIARRRKEAACRVPRELTFMGSSRVAKRTKLELTGFASAKDKARGGEAAPVRRPTKWSRRSPR